MLTGHHLIAGVWTPGQTTFLSSPATGAALPVANGTAADVDAACRTAEAAFATLPRAIRAALLTHIFDEIVVRVAQGKHDSDSDLLSCPASGVFAQGHAQQPADPCSN